MNVISKILLGVLVTAGGLSLSSGTSQAADGDGVQIGKARCSAERIGTSIPAAQIGEPVSAVTLDAPVWVEATTNVQAYCKVSGSMAPVDRSATAKPILFAIGLPAVWARRAMQLGGGGMNGTVPQLTGGAGGFGGPAALSDGFATYGSDSGHGSDPSWALNDEAIRNLAYLQMKKTHDAAMVIMERVYGVKPKYNYYVGNSQGGREALTVAQRYPADYDGILSSVPIVNFTGLMLAPEWIRSAEKPLDRWVPATKAKAVVAEFMRQCDALDGRVDGVINNYVECRRIFNVTDGQGTANPWIARRCPNNVDANPKDESEKACLTDGQIETLKLIFSNYRYKVALANNVHSFGMWAPTTEVAGGGGPPPGMMPGAAAGGPPAGGPPAGMPAMGGGMPVMATLLAANRYKGQEGAAADAATYSHGGILGLTGFILHDVNANPLDYAEGGALNERRVALSYWLDSTDPDLSVFRKRGGKLIVTIGTNDPTASSGSQLDYYQSVLDKMGRADVDSFARLYVLPQTGHGLSGSSFSVDGNGVAIDSQEIPATVDRFKLLRDWVEKGIAPGKSVTATGSAGSRPMCSYPDYPRYRSGDPSQAVSYVCAAPR